MLNLALLILFLLVEFSDAANKYAKPGGSGDGSSWSSAGGTAIVNNCGPGDVVYLAGGNYGNGFAVTSSGSA